MTTRSEQKTPLKRLSITDMPRDPQGCTGTLRKAICDSVNYCKRYPAKLAILKGILKFAYNYTIKYEQSVLDAAEGKVGKVAEVKQTNTTKKGK